MKAMKIIKSVMAALPLILPFVVFAETEKVGEYTWQYSVVDGKAWIGSGVAETAAIFPKPIGEVTVPSELGGYEVWRLDDYALCDCNEMTKLIIPDCVHQLGAWAFWKDTALSEIVLPSNLEWIPEQAFRQCSSLREICLPPHVTRIDGDSAFGQCHSLTNILIPSSVRSIGANTFLACGALKEVVIPNSVTNIGIYAFSYCTGLESLTLPFIGSERGNSGTAESVFGHIFGLSASEGLTKVVQTYTGSSTITRYIPVSLKRIVISDEEVVAKGAFDNCTMIEGIEINNGVTSVGERAFSACPLTTMTIPNSVTNIGRNVFSGCSELKSLILPFIGSKRGNDTSAECVFGWIFGESSVSSSDDNKYIQVKQWCNGGPFSCQLPKSLKSVVIADETVVAYAAFDDCRNLESVVIGNSVTNIQSCAFTACIGLQSLTLPFVGAERNSPSGTKESMFGYIFGVKPREGLVQVRQSLGLAGSGWVTNYVPNVLTDVMITDETQVGYGAFYGCSMITNISLNVGIESIGGYSFRNCTGIQSIVIPDSVKRLNIAAFRGSGLESIFVPLSVMDMSSWTFESCGSLHLAYVPRRFKGNLGYNTFANCAADLQVIYYDENMRFFDETLQTEDDSETNLVAVCTNDCRVTFKWKCSCEPLFKGNPYDYLSFSIDGEQQSFICGETDWTEQSYTVSGVGEHVFKWTYQKDAQDAAGEDCGWVKQVVVAPLVILSFDGGEAESGEPPDMMPFYADDDAAVLPGCGTLAHANHSFTGWSDGDTVYAAGSACPYLITGQTLTAVWEANTLSAPVITAPATYEADSATVTISADEGASIYYTLDGSMPSATATLYTVPFDVEGSATVRAIAVRDNYFDSEVSQFEVTRLTWTFGEYLNCPERTFTTGGDAEWMRAKGVSADGFALRSGAVTHSQTSRIETVVYGAGTIRFSCKVDGEIVKKIVYDGLAFCLDGVQQGDLIGDSEWTEKTFTVTGDGRHVLRWCYVKDEDGSGGGADCAWLDCVSWTADDPLPALDVSATDNDAVAIVGGLSDVRLVEKVCGTTAYSTFRSWVDSNGLSHAVVRDAPNAWLSYALDAPGLMAKATPIASEDVAIESIEPSGITSGAFDLVVDIAGAEIGTAANLAEVFGVEGAAELDESAFSSKGLSVTLQRTTDGKAKATVVPDGAPPAFFLRVKVK